jgi:diguanylate cyclase (GGDEF)-like protein/putative nucleotidyltransferase with HDIG domain
VSAVQSEFGYRGDYDQGPENDESLPIPAKIYLFFIVALSLAFALPLMSRLPEAHGWITFLILAVTASVAQLYNVRTPNDQSYHTAIVFLTAAVLLLPPELVVLVAVITHVPEWLKIRYAWYIQTFNIANYALSLLAAWGCVQAIMSVSLIEPRLRFALAGLAASIVLVFVNHILLAGMLRLGRGHSIREAGLFSFQSLSTELVLAALGVSVAAFAGVNPWLIPFTITSILLIHRSLAVPQLEAEARVDAKTGLFNARHFAAALTEELGRAQRFERPLSLIMADLDLLRDINNTYGHLAGDAVLKGIAQVFRAQLRHYDIPARFGGEEFSILLPETPAEQAMEIAERIRRAVAEAEYEVETSSEPIRATVSIGVAAVPKDATDANELIHQADLAVYRAKLQGRNRVMGASTEPLMMAPDTSRGQRLIAVPEDGEHVAPLPRVAESLPAEERRQSHPRPHALQGPRFLSLSRRLVSLVGAVGFFGVLAGVLGIALGNNDDLIGLLAIVALVGIGQALTLDVDDASISVSAVGAIAGAALFGPRAALALAVTTAVVEWSARRTPLHTVAFNVGALSLASLAAAGVFGAAGASGLGSALGVAGVFAGLAYYAVNMGLVSFALALEGVERWLSIFRERFAWLTLHYVVYGFISGVMAIAYEAAGLYALAVFAVPLVLMRKTQAAYISHTQRSAHKLRAAAETIQTQNVSLEQANRLLKERSTAAMESLSATVDARDSYTAGHSRRVQQLALAIGREMGLSQAELDLLGHAALFHDIGKLAIPDAILLKPASLTSEEWSLMQRHAEEGARIIDRLGFLGDAVPAIRHHHERFDGTGYPERLKGEEIPLGARIIHVADALDSMLTTRIYRAARPPSEALAELKRASGSQFCPRTVAALDRILPIESLDPGAAPNALLAAAV